MWEESYVLGDLQEAAYNQVARVEEIICTYGLEQITKHNWLSTLTSYGGKLMAHLNTSCVFAHARYELLFTCN